jgi:hypothetical protein
MSLESTEGLAAAGIIIILIQKGKKIVLIVVFQRDFIDSCFNIEYGKAAQRIFFL